MNKFILSAIILTLNRHIKDLKSWEQIWIRSQLNQSYCYGTEISPSGSGQAVLSWAGQRRASSLPDIELADTRKLIWSGTTAAPQEPTNDSGTTTTPHTKIISISGETAQRQNHTYSTVNLSLTLTFYCRQTAWDMGAQIPHLHWKHPHTDTTVKQVVHTLPPKLTIKCVPPGHILLWRWLCYPSWWVSPHQFKKSLHIKRKTKFKVESYWRNTWQNTPWENTLDVTRLQSGWGNETEAKRRERGRLWFEDQTLDKCNAAAYKNIGKCEETLWLNPPSN